MQEWMRVVLVGVLAIMSDDNAVPRLTSRTPYIPRQVIVRGIRGLFEETTDHPGRPPPVP